MGCVAPELTSACAAEDSAMALAAGPANSAVVANRVFFRLYQASNLMHKQGTRCVSEFGTNAVCLAAR
jgi:hypothetical protein